jgi:hypothetical protein
MGVKNEMAGHSQLLFTSECSLHRLPELIRSTEQKHGYYTQNLY